MRKLGRELGMLRGLKVEPDDREPNVRPAVPCPLLYPPVAYFELL